jgi:hypothetical protein
MYLKKMVESYWYCVKDPASGVPNYKDETCYEVSMCTDKYVWQNTFHGLGFVV